MHLLAADPYELPSEAAEARALAMLRSRFAEVTSQRFDEPVFFDAGQSFEKVACPSCGETLDKSWWAEAMDAAHTERFADLSVHPPCCGVETTLSELRYEMPQGFARFALSIRNPGRDLEGQERRELEGLLGTKLRIVWTRV